MAFVCRVKTIKLAWHKLQFSSNLGLEPLLNLVVEVAPNFGRILAKIRMTYAKLELNFSKAFGELTLEKVDQKICQTFRSILAKVYTESFAQV